MIDVNVGVLNECIAELNALTVSVNQTADQISGSKGNAASTEKSILTALGQFASADLPALFGNSANLLAAVAAGFQWADQQAAESYKGRADE